MVEIKQVNSGEAIRTVLAHGKYVMLLTLYFYRLKAPKMASAVVNACNLSDLGAEAAGWQV